jgi:mono/diheme cytochrome c family protein
VTVRVAFGILLSASVLLPSCTANRKPSSFETNLANIAKDVAIPLEAHRTKSPIPPGDEAIQAGREAYLRACTLCHGADGHGDTGLGRGMYPPASDLTSPHVQQWTDADLFWIIQNGIGLTGMPSWKSTLSEAETWQLAAFIHAIPRLDRERASTSMHESAPGPADLVTYGKTLYRQEGCFTCHQLEGEGTAVGPDLTVEGDRQRTDAWLTGHFKDPPAYTPGSIMPSFDSLMPVQIQALTVFLQGQKGGASNAIPSR